jgi:T-complex protein 1 subunit gamma
MIELSRA